MGISAQDRAFKLFGRHQRRFALIVDDPLLALIVRFVVSRDQLDMSDDEFIQRQLQTLRDHVERFPAHEQTTRAMEWVAENAENYRRNWQKNVISRRAPNERCPDCPLTGGSGTGHCEVHSHWLQLLRMYLAGELTSDAYVEDTLELLHQHKADLRVTGQRQVV